MNKKLVFRRWYFWLLIILPILAIGTGIFIFVQPDEAFETSIKYVLTAEDVFYKLKEKNANVRRYVNYTEESDINNLLGRPNQYTSKVTFEDIRLKQTNKDLDPTYFSQEEINEPIGGTIEVFNNTDDLKKRKDYVDSITSSISALAEYSYSNNYILLRLNHDLTPAQASEYENILKTVFD